MQIVRNADIWEMHANGHWVVITTNMVVKRNGLAVMGAGIAKAAADRYPDLPGQYGGFLKNTPAYIAKSPVELNPRLYMFPTKIDWRNNSSLDLIAENAEHLVRLNYHRIFKYPDTNPLVYLPALGCGMGGLNVDDVVARVSPILDNNFVMIINE